MKMLDLILRLRDAAKEKHSMDSIARPGALLKIFIAEYLGLEIKGNELYDSNDLKCKVLFAKNNLNNFQLANIDVRGFARISSYKRFIFCSMVNDFEIDNIYVCDDNSLFISKVEKLLHKHRKTHINITGKWVKDNCKELIV